MDKKFKIIYFKDFILQSGLQILLNYLEFDSKFSLTSHDLFVRLIKIKAKCKYA